MFGWNFPIKSLIPTTDNITCRPCNLYHTKKFSGWRCACSCHEPEIKQPEKEELVLDFDWNEGEIKTNPGF